MDQKYLAEIKAQLDAGRIPMKSDMEALLAEVERLTAENEKMKPFYKIADDTFKHWENAAYAMRDEERTRSAAKDQQIATLKKALLLMGNDLADWMGNGTGEFWAKDYTTQAQEQEKKA